MGNSPSNEVMDIYLADLDRLESSNSSPYDERRAVSSLEAARCELMVNIAGDIESFTRLKQLLRKGLENGYLGLTALIADVRNNVVVKSSTGNLNADDLDRLVKAICKYDEIDAIENVVLKSRCLKTVIEVAGTKSLLRCYKTYLNKRERIINKNLPFVVYFAKRIRGTRLQFEDIVQAGNEGLLIAIDKFDCTRGIKFSSFASNWIRKQMEMLRKDANSLLSYPVGVFRQINELRREQDAFIFTHGYVPTDEELAMHMGCDVKTITDIKANQYVEVSLATPVTPDTDDGRLLSDILKSESIEYAEDVHRERMHKVLKRVLSNLRGTDRQALACVYGIDGISVHSTKEAGKRLSCHAQSIRERCKRGMAQIKKCSEPVLRQ